MQRLHFTTAPSETYEGPGNEAEQTVSFIFTRRPELQLMRRSMKPATVIFSRGKGAKPVETLVNKNDFPKPPWGGLAGKQHPKTKKNKSFPIQVWCLIAMAAAGALTIRTTPQPQHRITGQL